MSLLQQLRGTGVALVTPFQANFSVDHNALGKVIDFVIDGGVEYIVTMGTTGETLTLSKEEKRDIILYTYEKVAGRVPVVVGVGGNNTAELEKELAWFPLDKARVRLSYQFDIDTLDEALEQRRKTRTLVVLRHGQVVLT